MAISFVGTARAAATSVALPAHQAGDLIVIYAMTINSEAPATVPGTYATIGSVGSLPLGVTALGSSVIAGYLIAASSSEVSGTWTNATEVEAVVYRGVDTSDPIGGVNTANSGSGTSLTIPAVTLEVGDGTSWVAVGFSLDQADADALTLSGLTRRNQNSGTTPNYCTFDTNAGVASFSAINDTGYISNEGKAAIAFEIKVAAAAATTHLLGLMGVGV